MEKVTNLDFIKGFSKGDMSRVKKVYHDVYT
jgi:hypothetical protein